MSPEEDSALTTLLREHFQLKAHLAFEQQCIDNAMRELRGVVQVVVSQRPDKLEALTSIIDSATKALQRRRGE